jgi:hypothetical protein
MLIMMCCLRCQIVDARCQIHSSLIVSAIAWKATVDSSQLTTYFHSLKAAAIQNPHTTHRSQLTSHCSPLTAHYILPRPEGRGNSKPSHSSPITAHISLLTSHCSPLTPNYETNLFVMISPTVFPSMRLSIHAMISR